MPEDSQVRSDFSYLDKVFGGSKPWEMAIMPAKQTDDVMDYDYLQEALKIESFLKDSFGMQNFMSPVDVVKYANQIDNGGANRLYEFPDRADFKGQKSIRNQLISRGVANGVMDSGGQYARFAGFIPEWGPVIRKREIIN